MSPAEASVESIYLNAQDNLDLMLAACPTQDERDEVDDQYQIALNNYYACINQVFQNDDPTMIELVERANQTADELAHIAEQLGDVAKVIRTITTGAEVGTAIVAKIIPFA